jgi:ABC-type branched-subunit amino acid transport system substrate-binding protein
MPDELTPEQTNKLMDFRRKWLMASGPENPEEVKLSNKKIGEIVNAIRGEWSGLEPNFLLEPILQILLERQFELQNDNLETIQQKLIKSLSLKKSQDDNFNNKLEEYLETNTVNAENHPLLSGFWLPETTPEIIPEITPETTPTPLLFYVVVGALSCGVLLGMLILYILMRLGLIIDLVQPPPTSLSNSPSKSDILALCNPEAYQGNAEYYISCGSKDLKDFSKKSLTEMDKIIQDLDKEFDFNKKAVLEERASTLIALNNAKILRDLQSNKLKSEDIYPIAAVVPKTDKEGAVYAGKRMLAGIAFKQKKINELELDAQKKRLLIIIADDKNEVGSGQVIAKKLIQITQILGVVGPYASSRYYHVYQKYDDGKLTVISPSVTAAKSDFQDMEKLQKKGQKFTCANEEIEGITPKFFFRPVGDTEASTITTLDYLKKHGITKLIVFVQTDDLYSCSLLRRLEAKVKERKHEVSIYRQIFLDGEQKDLSGPIEELTKDQNLKKENTAIIYFQGAFTNKYDADEYKLSNVIQANKGHFLFVGSNPVIQSQLIKSYLKNYKNTLIIQPWFPSSPKPKEVEEQENFWKYDSNSDNFVTWHYVMAYDATQMFLYAINQFVNNNQKYPTREGINEILAGTTVQNPGCNKNVEGITGDTFTDNITLDGSDRCPPGGNNGYALIQFDPNLKQWKKAD